jgi:hypothetical protein
MGRLEVSQIFLNLIYKGMLTYKGQYGRHYGRRQYA